MVGHHSSGPRCDARGHPGGARAVAGAMIVAPAAVAAQRVGKASGPGRCQEAAGQGAVRHRSRAETRREVAEPSASATAGAMVHIALPAAPLPAALRRRDLPRDALT